MSDELDLARLREVAEAATPGPWEASVGWFDRDCPKDCEHRTHTDGPAVFESPSETALVDEWAIRKRDAAHFAAFDPPTVLALIDEVEALRAKAVRVEALAEEFAHEYAATIDGEWGCCHDEDALRAGGRAPEFDGDEFQPLPADCSGKRHLDRSLSRLRAALAPAPTEGANGRQAGSDERVGTKEDA